MKERKIDYLFVSIVIVNLLLFTMSYFRYQLDDMVDYKVQFFFFLISAGISIRNIIRSKELNIHSGLWVISLFACALMLIKWVIFVIRYLILMK